MFKAVPACYNGRNSFDNAEEVIEYWKNGKDFLMRGGGYFSIRDFDSLKKDISPLDLLMDGDTVLVVFFNKNGNPKTVGSFSVKYDGSIV